MTNFIKKSILFLLTAFLLSGMPSIPLQAAENFGSFISKEGNVITYEINSFFQDGDGPFRRITVRGQGSMPDFGWDCMPEAPSPFSGDQANYAVIEAGITSIGNYTFFNNYNLTEATLPEGLVSIGDYAFRNCQHLMHVNIPDSVRRISDTAFSGSANYLTISCSSGSYACQYAKGHNINCKLTDIIEAERVTLNTSVLSLQKSKTAKLSASIFPSNVTDAAISWESSAPSIASVSNGRVTAISRGTATITATTANGKAARCTVTVTEPYQIIYQLNGGKNHKSNPGSYLDGTVSLKSPMRKGHTFAGWYSDPSFRIKISCVSNCSQTVYAKWKKVAAPAKASTPALSNKAGGKLKVTFQKTKGADGYQLQYANNKGFKKAVTKTVKKNAVSYKLKKGKTYYVRIRAYKLDSAKSNVCGKWSSIKKIKLQK